MECVHIIRAYKQAYKLLKLCTCVSVVHEKSPDLKIQVPEQLENTTNLSNLAKHQHQYTLNRVSWPYKCHKQCILLANIAAPLDHAHYKHPRACAIGRGTKFILGELSINIANFNHNHQAYSSIMDQNIWGGGPKPYGFRHLCAHNRLHVQVKVVNNIGIYPSHLMINDADADSRRAQGICSLELQLA